MVQIEKTPGPLTERAQKPTVSNTPSVIGETPIRYLRGRGRDSKLKRERRLNFNLPMPSFSAKPKIEQATTGSSKKGELSSYPPGTYDLDNKGIPHEPGFHFQSDRGTLYEVVKLPDGRWAKKVVGHNDPQL